MGIRVCMRRYQRSFVNVPKLGVNIAKALAISPIYAGTCSSFITMCKDPTVEALVENDRGHGGPGRAADAKL